jgi:uncharacterized protein
MIRVAAVADIHAGPETAGSLAPLLTGLREEADILFLAGDLTRAGKPTEAEILAAELAEVGVPVVAVLGNHDYHENRCDELVAVLREAGIRVLQRESAIFEVGELEVGVVGSKGFVGGFPGAELPDFGEPLLREVYAETTREVEAIEAGLEAISGCHRRIVLLHYAPVPETLVGEPETIWAFLGSSRLAAPLGAHRPDLVLHGHAHRGSFEAALGPVPIRNVAVHVTGKDFELFEL